LVRDGGDGVGDASTRLRTPFGVPTEYRAGAALRQGGQARRHPTRYTTLKSVVTS